MNKRKFAIDENVFNENSSADITKQVKNEDTKQVKNEDTKQVKNEDTIQLKNEDTNKLKIEDKSSIEDTLLKNNCYKNDQIDLNFTSIRISDLKFKKIKAENLDLDYVRLFPVDVASELLKLFEDQLEYIPEEKSVVKIFGKVHKIPRKQMMYGDPGVKYKYSGLTLTATSWPESLRCIRNFLKTITGHYYNFVLVNRYKDGSDKIGEHKDDEKELDTRVPIASLSFGEPRKFYFKHQDARNKNKRKIDKVSMVLESGSLLLMNCPTNKYWYHALPPSKSVSSVRINFTFRKILL